MINVDVLKENYYFKYHLHLSRINRCLFFSAMTLPWHVFLILQEQELEKQKLLFHQARLANRGVAEMVLLHVSAARGQPSEMVMMTLKLGIAILRGGNVDVQAVSNLSRVISVFMSTKQHFKLWLLHWLFSLCI